MVFLREWSPWGPIGICAVYLLFCYLGTLYMKNRKAYGLNRALMLWNFALAMFSLMGALRTVPHLANVIALKGYKYTITEQGRDWVGGGAVGFWAQMFVFSKIPELGDTVFIVLRKRPLIFLHWYHHVTVLLYCWHSYYNEAAYGLYFAAMNYSVHAVMYLYYALAALRIRLCKPYYVTTLQISQMFVGIAVCCSCWIYYKKGYGEHIKEGNLWAGAIMYASYAFLFLQYAISRFIKKVMSKEDGAVTMNGNGRKAAATNGTTNGTKAGSKQD
ncbi:fatty acid elongase [Tribonema minus]|uniref:Elongation of fatty acids protein n=1 Tax=Tribonema minus TaxID=303371 RepID=A0A836CLW9_9STRA|nr:fatty acid elongase [Tribonema minus]